MRSQPERLRWRPGPHTATGARRTATPRSPSARRRSTPGRRQIDARLAELEERERAVEERERIPPDPDAARLAQIDARLDELRAAEEAFLRTRRELADHSDAIAAREQLLAQRERDLDEREDGWGGPDVRELEARLRKLETQRTALGQTQGFSGGFRKLEQEGTRRPPTG